MATKFFNNSDGNTLINKFRDIANNMSDFYTFDAVVGYFRSSGYFKLRSELENVKKIQILVGINIDNIFRKHNRAMLMFGHEQEAKDIYNQDFIDDIKKAKYSKEVEEGILQLCEDLVSGRVEMRINNQKNLHAKFYLCLPEKFNPSSDGWVIMGSSNISDSGLGITEAPRYELNVALKDYDDVSYCKDEFEKLWEDAIAITKDDIDHVKGCTHLGVFPTPYEIYIKVLIDTFGDQVEDDFSITLPDGVSDLKYQKDAVVQGYQMLLAHNGFFLADVVGLGKTIVATMIAKRFIEANGRSTNILVVYPPALEDNWKETFKLFGINKKAQFISNGSLSNVIDGKNNYKDKEEYDMVIVDEAHGFRTDTTDRYDCLQRICKSPRQNIGLLGGEHKKIMLLSATPLNNRPDDLLNLLLLFQDSNRCTIEGINNLQTFFSPLILEYKRLMKNRYKLKDTKDIDKIYTEIRDKVIDKVTVRRTRHNIENDDYYKQDLDAQNIKFPKILPPYGLEYKLDSFLSRLFYETLDLLTDTPTQENPNGTGLHYAKYRALEYLTDEKAKKFKNVIRLAENLAGIYRVHMVKRLESSFYAFKRSLDTLSRITDDMIQMFDEGKVIVAPDLNIKDLQAKGWELDKILEYALAKGYDENDITYLPSDFKDDYIKHLIEDSEKLRRLKDLWSQVNNDPKLDLFIETINNELFDKTKNPTGKLVVFSESVDTVNYLKENLINKLHRHDIIDVCSHNHKHFSEIIRQCFDANYDKVSNEYNIVITSDVLAEGINLHRANVVVNYDSPWNASRLMQRIGRVNRIGSIAGEIYNYMFYPSTQGNAQIQLYKNALIKLQGFHSALGEDAQIYSREEIVKDFQLYDPDIKDKMDKQLQLLREVRELYSTDRELYKKIKNLPMKSRTSRISSNSSLKNTTIAFLSSPRKIQYYKIDNENIFAIDFIDAAFILKALKGEPCADFKLSESIHFRHVNKAIESFEKETYEKNDTGSIGQQVAVNKSIAMVQKFLRLYMTVTTDSDIKTKCATLLTYIQNGIYSQLAKSIRSLALNYKGNVQLMKPDEYKINTHIDNLYKKYYTVQNEVNNIDNTSPDVVISETFI